jgi:hypothetical protein
MQIKRDLFLSFAEAACTAWRSQESQGNMRFNIPFSVLSLENALGKVDLFEISNM